MKQKICILSIYPFGIAPGSRFRHEQYIPYIESSGFHVDLFSFYNDREYRLILSPGKNIQKIIILAKCFLLKLFQLPEIKNYDYVFIHREITPLGPAIFEWAIAKILRKRIIYDFDDAIWMPQEGYASKLKAFLKNPSKVNSIIKWSYKVSCGNAYLCNHARLFNKNVVLNPTTIDTINLHNQLKNQAVKKIAIGWTGTYSTLMYLDPLIPVIERLEKEFDFDFIVICNKQPDYSLRSYKYIAWNKATEIDDLLKFNFGLMPLLEDKWTEGKCGFKALQYMALGMPAVVSPVGVNKIIVDKNINGYLCQTEEEWYEAIKTLIQNESIRISMGKEARKKVVYYYSVESNKENFLKLFS